MHQGRRRWQVPSRRRRVIARLAARTRRQLRANHPALRCRRAGCATSACADERRGGIFAVSHRRAHSVVHDDIQQRTVNLQAAVVFDASTPHAESKGGRILALIGRPKGARPAERASPTGDYGYCRSTVKRLMEYPSAPPMKTSDKKWADSESLENPTTAASP